MSSPIKTIIATVAAAFAFVAVSTASAQSQQNIRNLVFFNAQQPQIRIDMTYPIVYKADGSVVVTCVPIASDPTRCFESAFADPRSPRVTLSSSLPWANGSQEIYSVASGQSFWVYRAITNSADVCVPGSEGVAQVDGWTSTAATNSSQAVLITVNIPTGQSRDITLTLRCYNQYGAPSEPFRRVYRVFR